MRYSGDVYRPPSEAHSLIVQVTYGCSHNKCAFCNMYKAKRFSIRPIEEVFEDLEWARAHYAYIERVFLADGDALILPMEHLQRILEFIRERIPECQRVAVYGSPKSIITKTPAQLETLHAEGLGIVYMGLESGNEELLKRYNKGETAAQIVEAGLKVRRAGLTLSVTAINGLEAGVHRPADAAVRAADAAHARLAGRPLLSDEPDRDRARNAHPSRAYRLRGQHFPRKPRLQLRQPRRHAQPRPRRDVSAPAAGARGQGQVPQRILPCKITKRKRFRLCDSCKL